MIFCLHIKSNNPTPLRPRTHKHTLSGLVVYRRLLNSSVPLSKVPFVWYYLPWCGKLFPSKSNMRNKCCFPSYEMEYSTNWVHSQASAKWACSEPDKAWGMLLVHKCGPATEKELKAALHISWDLNVRTPCQGWFLTEVWGYLLDE